MIAVVLAGGPFDGTEHEVTTPTTGLVVRKVCAEHIEHNVVARYYPTGDTDRAGRLIYRYEAP